MTDTTIESNFNYEQFTSRNIGFVTIAQQEVLRRSRVLVIGVGGMGGIVVQCLARSGVENFVLADFDTFETNNLNRQVFAFTDGLGRSKVEVTCESLKKINPKVHLTTYDRNWTGSLEEILPHVDVVVNGCDDLLSTILLMRTAKLFGKTVVEAFSSPMPSLYVIKPTDPRPEEFMRFPSVGTPWKELTAEHVKNCARQELIYVLTHSSSAQHIHMDIAAEMINGQRSRMSFAPMVWVTGTLMAYETIHLLLKIKTRATYRGLFFNPRSFAIERPRSGITSWLKRIFVKSMLKSMVQKPANGVRK